MKRWMKSTCQRSLALIKDGWLTVRQDAWKAFLIGLLAIPAALALVVCFAIGISLAVIVMAIVVAVFTVVCLALIIVAAAVLTGLIFTPLYTVVSLIGRRFSRQKRLVVR